MTVHVDVTGRPAAAGDNWYARSPEQVAADLGVDPATGLTPARAAELLAANGPKALPEEEPKPGWRRFLAEYRSYMHPPKDVVQIAEDISGRTGARITVTEDPAQAVAGADFIHTDVWVSMGESKDVWPNGSGCSPPA